MESKSDPDLSQQSLQTTQSLSDTTKYDDDLIALMKKFESNSEEGMNFMLSIETSSVPSSQAVFRISSGNPSTITTQQKPITIKELRELARSLPQELYYETLDSIITEWCNIVSNAQTLTTVMVANGLQHILSTQELLDSESFQYFIDSSCSGDVGSGDGGGGGSGIKSSSIIR